jgi:hypothetical protein
MAKPNPDRKRALWHLDCATNLNPKFNEAIEMKAQLTGEEVTSVDNSTIKSFVSRVALADRRRPTTMPSDAAAAPAAPAAPVPTPAVQAPPTTQPTSTETAKAESAPSTEAAADTETAAVSTEEAAETDLGSRQATPSGFEKSTVVEVDLDEEIDLDLDTLSEK